MPIYTIEYIYKRWGMDAAIEHIQKNLGFKDPQAAKFYLYIALGEIEGDNIKEPIPDIEEPIPNGCPACCRALDEIEQLVFQIQGITSKVLTSVEQREAVEKVVTRIVKLSREA